MPIADDDLESEPKIVSANFVDPYILLLKDDASVTILKADETGDLEDIDRGEVFVGTKWLSGALYEDSNDVLRLESGEDDDEESGNVLIFLLTAAGGLQVNTPPTAIRRYKDRDVYLQTVH